MERGRRRSPLPLGLDPEKEAEPQTFFNIVRLFLFRFFTILQLLLFMDLYEQIHYYFIVPGTDYLRL